MLVFNNIFNINIPEFINRYFLENIFYYIVNNGLKLFSWFKAFSQVAKAKKQVLLTVLLLLVYCYKIALSKPTSRS
ncbi:hypothetical protein VIGAN_01416400 [Vigna angularis var. angularis]|uniref:Uncharacterized protein n=1 Tax=Vigna angularis var. angularis TaxID=157739 RepID=A0A0S3R6P0_PHAAN|nr:hypothetical protein VIGAN_01416400 [Vigna angularis var. angularis]